MKTLVLKSILTLLVLGSLKAQAQQAVSYPIKTCWQTDQVTATTFSVPEKVCVESYTIQEKDGQAVGYLLGEPIVGQFEVNAYPTPQKTFMVSSRIHDKDFSEANCGKIGNTELVFFLEVTPELALVKPDSFTLKARSNFRVKSCEMSEWKTINFKYEVIK